MNRATMTKAKGIKSPETKKGAHWMVLVNWNTIAHWKSSVKSAKLPGSSLHPYQYGSSQGRFTEIAAGDVLWILATPRFSPKDRPKSRGRARPPAVMARLRVETVCCNDPESKSCKNIPECKNKVSIFSDGWPIVVFGEKDIEKEEADPLKTTYPALYNAYGVMSRLRFQTKKGITCLDHRLNAIETKSDKYWDDNGPYGRLAQSFQRLRKLTDESAEVMDELHKRAVLGRRVFFSYRWADTEDLAIKEGKSRGEWIRELNLALDEENLVPWLDHHQLAPEGPDTGLLEELLSDAVRQATLFVALVTPNYGVEGSWSATEWTFAGELQNRLGKDGDFKNEVRRIAINLGGDLSRLEDGIPFEVVAVADQRIETIAEAIAAHVV